jgi:hypothetical protein
MARQVNQVLWDQWRQRLRRQRGSGLPIVEFCRREGVSPHGFHVWRRKLAKAAPGRKAGREPVAMRPARRQRGVVAECRSPRPRAGRAVPTHPTDFLQLPVTAARPSPWIELALADGTVVRLPQQNLAALLVVLRALRGEPFDLTPRGHEHA